MLKKSKPLFFISIDYVYSKSVSDSRSHGFGNIIP